MASKKFVRLAKGEAQQLFEPWTCTYFSILPFELLFLKLM